MSSVYPILTSTPLESNMSLVGMCNFRVRLTPWQPMV
jgi:hypothetical protein